MIIITFFPIKHMLQVCKKHASEIYFDLAKTSINQSSKFYCISEQFLTPNFGTKGKWLLS